jgi:hypothetical protein
MDDDTLLDDPPSPVDWPKMTPPRQVWRASLRRDPQTPVDVRSLYKRRLKPSPNILNPASAPVARQAASKPKQQKIAPRPTSAEAAKSIRPPRLQSDNHPHEQPIARLFKECEDAAHQFQNAGTRRDHVLIKCLQKAAELYEYGRTQDPEGYRQLLADHNIRITKRTGNPFTPVVKLVFHALNQEKPTTLSRYASVLRYARDEGIAPANFSQILTEEGGIEACAKHDRGIHSSPERAAAIKKRDEYYRSLQAAALNPDFTAIGDRFPVGLSAVLVEMDEHGQVRLLGIKQERFLGVQRYLPLSKEA